MYFSMEIFKAVLEGIESWQTLQFLGVLENHDFRSIKCRKCCITAPNVLCRDVVQSVICLYW